MLTKKTSDNQGTVTSLVGGSTGCKTGFSSFLPLELALRFLVPVGTTYSNILSILGFLGLLDGLLLADVSFVEVLLAEVSFVEVLLADASFEDNLLPDFLFLDLLLANISSRPPMPPSKP
jgi:hypothetical protein